MKFEWKNLRYSFIYIKFVLKFLFNYVTSLNNLSLTNQYKK